MHFINKSTIVTAEGRNERYLSHIQCFQIPSKWM